MSSLGWIIWGMLALCVGAALLGGLLIRRRRRRLPGWRYPDEIGPPRYPIVLVHGFLGFDQLAVAGHSADYFRGVKERLEVMGATVHRPAMPPAAAIPERAAALASFVRGLDARRVNLIAHSMGGLDARFAISSLGLASRVASLTTVGTPHRGSPLADGLCNLVGEQRILRQTLASFGIGADGLHELTTTHLATFDRDIANVAKVAYYSVVCGFGDDDPRICGPLSLPFRLLRHQAGPNDGMVPMSSQAWGIVLDTLEVDHFAEVGWGKDFDAPRFYVRIARELRGRGH